MEGKQIAGVRKRTSGVLLHLEIMVRSSGRKSVVHCHPPHATAFAVAGEPIPQVYLPELKCSWASSPIAPYETPGDHALLKYGHPVAKATNTIILKRHGTVSFGNKLEDAYWKTEILDAYCRILLLAKQIGQPQYLL